MPNLIFGKVFATMFTGSMYGAGAPVFAVMTYVIANMQPDRDRVEFVRLNPQGLADTIGENKETIQKAIDFLCGTDAESNHKEESGRRLVLEGPYLYRVVNGRHYRELKDEEDRLAKDAVRAARYREKKQAEARSRPKFKAGKTLSERLAEKEFGDTGEIKDAPAAESYQAGGNGQHETPAVSSGPH